MKKCTRVGIDVTKRCNWKCQTCFYRYKQDFNTPYDRTLTDVMQETERAKARGCDHAVLVGWGEPGLWPYLIDWIKEVQKLGMTSSIITNGSVAIGHYAKMRDAGLNHLHVSAHGIGETLDTISGIPGSGEKQLKLMQWLQQEQWAWRMNMTVQQANYQELASIANTCIMHGCRHIISLGFLPHYDWNDPNKMREVAVHPGVLKPYIQAVADEVIGYNVISTTPDNYVMFTIRYHPMCHLDEEYRKYVVNARYVLLDRWEWDYGTAGLPPESHWNECLNIGNSVAIQTAPCTRCGLQMHCGGWNRVYAAGFNGAGLEGVTMPIETQVPGYLHDQNPANHEKGWF
jgi:MoaA/NifB/PqqE/SkfB family radical SAM enzyme